MDAKRPRLRGILLRGPVAAAVSSALVLVALVSGVTGPANAQPGMIGPPEMDNAVEVTSTGPGGGFTFRFPSGWTVIEDEDETSTLLLNVPATLARSSEAAAANRLLITTENRVTHENALQRLRDIASETSPDIPIEYLVINGWPALQRSYADAMPRIGEKERQVGVRPTLRRVTVAIAAGSQIIRVEGTLLSDTKGEVEEVFGMGRAIAFEAPGNPTESGFLVEELRQQDRSRPQPPRQQEEQLLRWDEQWNSPATFEGEESEVGLVQNLLNFSEIETVVSPDGATIIVATNGRNYSVSNDGGQTFTQSAVSSTFDNSPPPSPSIAYPANGDPSLAYGQSGDFYFGFIAFPDGSGGPGTGNDVQQCTTGLAASTDNGQTFSHRGHATTCPFSGAGVCFPDQEHIAADRWNPSSSGGDQVYNTWRNFTTTSGANCDSIGSGSVQTQLRCSTDSGVTWGPALNLGGDFPRVTVGADGFVYVVTRSGGNIVLDKYSSCDAGLAQEPNFPATVGPATAVACPVPGLDRCNDGNDLRSPTVAVDDLDPSHVFVSYASNTVAGNEDIFTQDSTDGGVNFSAPVRLNNGFAARRYMPWTCAVGGTAYTGWFDRRSANALDNSLTDFYVGSVSRVGGNLVAGPELRVSPDADSNCNSGWPCAPRSTNDSESCTDQPQLAGVCRDTAGNRQPAPFRCDFSQASPADNPCNEGFNCVGGGGCPKYGDYNGIACGAGRVYAAYASATPPGGPQTTQIDSFLLQEVVCCTPQIQVPGPVTFESSCDLDAQTEELNVCNTGVENLEVTSIGSSDTQFSVTDPSSGFPVQISPDFCFPFQVNFDPTGSGVQSAVLTIENSDTVNPSVDVDVSGEVGDASIDTFIANSGNIGEVCSGLHGDLNLAVQNSGACDLTIDSVALSGADTSDFELPDGSLSGTVIEAGNSLLVPIRFAPSNFTNPSPRTASVDIESSSPDGDSLPLDQTPVSGSVPPPDINVAIANSGNFGAVCEGGFADLDLTLFNQGRCDLTIDPIASDNGQFILPTNTTYPLVLSHDAQFTLPVRFEPTDCGLPTSGNITITSDSPGESPLSIGVSGESPCPNLVIDPPALSDVFAFPATVADTTGSLGCFTDQSMVLRNTGACPLTISGVSASADDFSVLAPSQFPIVLPPGEETLGVTVRFTPQSGGDPLAPDEITGLLTVASDDPDAAGEANLCGEGVVQSGVRILVADVSSGVPVPIDFVDDMSVTSKGKSIPGPINLRFTDQPYSSSAVCGNTVEWHVNLETLPATHTEGSNSKSSYTAKAKEGNLQTEQRFLLNQCEFRQFQLQLKDSDSTTCLLLPKGDSCVSNAQCCSGKCRGPQGGKVCK